MSHVLFQLSAGCPIENRVYGSQEKREDESTGHVSALSYQENNEDKGLSTAS